MNQFKGLQAASSLYEVSCAPKLIGSHPCKHPGLVPLTVYGKCLPCVQASSGAKEAPTQKYPQFTGQGLSDDDPCSSLGLYDSDINKAFTYPDVSQTTSGAPAWPSPSPWLSSGHHDKPPTLPPSPRQETPKYPQVSLRPSPEGAGFNTDGQRVVPKASKWQRPSWLPSKHRDSPETMVTFNEAYGEHLSKRPPGT